MSVSTRMPDALPPAARYARMALPLLLAVAASACGGPDGSGSAQEPSLPGQTSQPSVSPTAPDAGSPALHAGTGGSSPLPRLDSVEAVLKAQPIAASGSEGWRAPTARELQSFEVSLAELLATPDSPEARSALMELGFSTEDLRDVGGAQLLLVKDAQARGAGTVVLNLTPARNLWLEAPHATSDLGTGEQSARLLTSLGARALVVTGSDRCATSAPTPCTSGATTQCGGQLRASDAAHNTDTFFTAAHRALRAAFPHTPALSVHGFGTAGGEAAVVSDGTRAAASPDALSLQLREALNARLPQGHATSCNDPADGAYTPLCATTNVQGRIDNGSAEACRQSAARGSGLFLHLEQAPALRRLGADQDAVEEALVDTFGCSLAGPAKGCATAAADVP